MIIFLLILLTIFGCLLVYSYGYKINIKRFLIVVAICILPSYFIGSYLTKVVKERHVIEQKELERWIEFVEKNDCRVVHVGSYKRGQPHNAVTVYTSIWSCNDGELYYR